MKFEAVLFDLDGTLLDSIEDLTDSMNIALDRLGFPEEEIVNLKSKLYEIKLTLRQLRALKPPKKH